MTWNIISNVVKYNKKKSILYPRIFIQVAAIVMATILAVSVLQYFNNRNNSVQQISLFNIDSLQQVSYSAELMADSAHNLIAQLYVDLSISNLIYLTNPDELQKTDALQRLNSFATCYNFIQSIYIYNGANKTFYTTISNASVSDEENFFDTGLTEIFKSPDKISVTMPISRKFLLPFVPRDDKNSTRVFSFIFCETDSLGGIDSAIVVNISESWFHDVIKNINTVKEGDIIVVDTEGNILTSYLNRHLREMQPQNGYIGKVLQSSSKSGFMTIDVSGVKSLVTYVSMEKLQWTFIRTTSFSEVMKETNNVLLETLIFSMLILLFGGVVSVFLAKMVYRPVDSVMSKLEIELAQNREDRNEYKNTLMCKLLLSEAVITRSLWEQQRKKYSIGFSFDDRVLLLLLKIDRFSEFCGLYNTVDRSLMKFAIMNIATEIASASFRVEAVDMSQDHVVLILEAGSGPDEEYFYKLRKLIFEIQEAVQMHLKISLSAATSNVGSFGDGPGILYQQVLDKSNYRFQFGYKSAIFYREHTLLDAGSYSFPQEKFEMLLDSLKLRNFDKSEALFQDIIQSTADFPFSTVQSVLSRVLVQVSSTLEAAEKAWGISISYELNYFIKMANTAETAMEIYTRFKDMLCSMDTKLSIKKAGRYDELIEEVTNIIYRDYANPGLCLEGIAETLGMSSVYLGRLFKKNVSKSVSDFILEYRIQKAMELLYQTRITIGEIVTNTGFSNTKYFYTLFKKFNGLTPNEYRLKSIKKESADELLQQNRPTAYFQEHQP